MEEIADKMHLAATQRPHPPPVPPRPSRQVVAEALKRSPRPPCPTRQAPPPPNTKPWRSDRDRSNNRQQVVSPAAGRTVVYESIKDSIPKETGNEGGDHDDPVRHVVDKSLGDGGNGGEPVARVSSERRVDEDDRRGNPRERRVRTPVVGQEYQGNSSEWNAVTGDVVSSPTSRRKEDRSNSCREYSSVFERVTLDERFFNGVTGGVRSPVNENGKQCIDGPTRDNAISETAISRTTESSDHGDVVAKPPSVVESHVSLNDVLRCQDTPSDASESTIGKSKSSISERNERSERRPIPTQRSCLVKYRDATTKKSAETRCTEGSNANSQPSVSNVDRATVVVIDELNRKATTSNDNSDNKNDRGEHVVDHDDQRDDHHDRDRANENDNDNDNIHRQDWLEAGIHYSSTQIRLSGEDGDVVDGTRINGYNRCENEKYSNFNVPR